MLTPDRRKRIAWALAIAVLPFGIVLLAAWAWLVHRRRKC